MIKTNKLHDNILTILCLFCFFAELGEAFLQVTSFLFVPVFLYSCVGTGFLYNATDCGHHVTRVLTRVKDVTA